MRSSIHKVFSSRGIILTEAWVLVQLLLFLRAGMKTSVDSTLYIDNAGNLLKGALSQGHDFWYSAYTSLVAFMFAIGANLEGVIIFQILMTGVAAWCLWNISLALFGDENAAFITTLLYIVWLKIHEWNFFIYTDSLFCSFCVITFYLLVTKRHILFIACFLFTVLIRPAGFGLVAAVCAFLYASFRARMSPKGRVVALIALPVLLLVLLNRLLYDFYFIPSYLAGEIIYPNISLGLGVPNTLYVPSGEMPPVFAHVLFMLGNPVYFAKITLVKFFLFLGNVKPYFSVVHNGLIVLILYPVYFFAARAFFLVKVGAPGKYFIITFIITQTLMVSLTSENWDGRFLIPLLPFIFILAGAGIVSTMNRVAK
jgi:hypothetical protein